MRVRLYRRRKTFGTFESIFFCVFALNFLGQDYAHHIFLCCVFCALLYLTFQSIGNMGCKAQMDTGTLHGTQRVSYCGYD